MERPLWQKLAAVALLTAALIWLSYNYYFKSKMAELEKLKETLKSIEREIDFIKPGDIIIGKDTSSLNRVIEEQLSRISEKLPDEVELPYIMDDFITASKNGINIDYKLFQPLGLAADKAVKRQSLNAALKGGFESLNLYLLKLENMPFITRIDQLDVSKDPAGKDLDMKVSVSMFMFPGGTPSAETKTATDQIPGFDPFFQTVINRTEEILRKGSGTKKRRRSAGRFRLPRFLGVYSGASVKAFIDDSVIGVGGTVNGYTLETITDKYVVVTKGANSYTLKLGR